MTAANNGASTPEDDDPFGYLYEDGMAAGATPPSQGRGYGYPGPAAQPGVPRTSYNQVRTVGERTYGQQVPQQQTYGQQAYSQQGAQQPTAQYAAPETYPGGAPTGQVPAQQNGHGGGRSGGPNTKGLLIGAIAVVAVVVIGIGAALLTDGDKDDTSGDDTGKEDGTTAGQQVKPSAEQSKPEEKPQTDLPKQDAATLQLGAPAALAKDVKGAKGAGGAYVAFNGVGGSASWSVDVPEGGTYTMFITYGVPGKDAKTSLTVNSEKPREINMSNFAKAEEGDWEKGWTRTYAYVNLQEGKNDLKISCEEGDQCEAFLDQVSLKQGEVS